MTSQHDVVTIILALKCPLCSHRAVDSEVIFLKSYLFAMYMCVSIHHGKKDLWAKWLYMRRMREVQERSGVFILFVLGRRKVHFTFKDGREMAEEYDLRDNRLISNGCIPKNIKHCCK